MTERDRGSPYEADADAIPAGDEFFDEITQCCDDVIPPEDSQLRRSRGCRSR